MTCPCGNDCHGEAGRLRAAIEPTEENAVSIARQMRETNGGVWLVEPFDVEDVLAAIAERARKP